MPVFFQKLHRAAGVASIIVILFVTITGLLLNHREGLALHDKYAENSAIQTISGTAVAGGQGEVADDEAEPPTWERVLTVLHSGRFFGANTNVILDLTALAILLLSLSGLYMWVVRRNSGRIGAIKAEASFMKTTDRMVEISRSTGGLKNVSGRLQHISKHMHRHIEESGDVFETNEFNEIKDHFKELDLIIGSLINRIDKITDKSD